MAKKKLKTKAEDGDLASEEILDSLAAGEEGDGADADDAEGVEARDGDEAEAPVIPRAGRSSSSLSDEFRAWPVDKDHASAASFLRGEGAGDPSKVVLEDEDEYRAGSVMNVILGVLIIAAAGAGVWQFKVVSSPETLAAKKAEKAAIEEAHLKEQQAKQKKYGVLRIESNPPQAVVFKDDEKIVTKSEATGEEIIGRTPMNLMDLDISQPVKIRLEAEGYAPFEFNVAEHLWTKDAASGEYKFFNMVELTPNVCEYWFLYDAKRKREMKFPEQGECATHYEDAMKSGTSVTECTCKIPPPGWEPPKDKGKTPPK